MSWKNQIGSHLHRLSVDVEEFADLGWRRLSDRLGLNQPEWVQAYRGYAVAGTCYLHGRVLSNLPRPDTGPGQDDKWWDNLLDTYRRFETDEVAGAEVTVRLGSELTTVHTNGEGDYRVELPAPRPAAGASLWQRALVAVERQDAPLLTSHPYLVVHPDAQYGVISDIDDTVLQTGITSVVTAAKLTFLHNARTRKPLDGAAVLYQWLQGQPARNPVFYVSSSPRNLYDLLEDFMELNALPAGPMALRDIGLDDTKVLKTKGHGHKLDKIRTLLQRCEGLPFILIGDSGQADAELYAEAAREFPGRILAIYIRDVDPDHDSAHDTKVDQHIAAVGDSVPMLRVADSALIAEHLVEQGLLPRAAIDAVAAEVRRDEQRPTPTEAQL